MKKPWFAASAFLVVVAAVIVAFIIGRSGGTDEGVVKVAVVLPQTGPQAAIGRGGTNSVRLAFAESEERLSQRGIEVELSYSRRRIQAGDRCDASTEDSIL